MAKRVKVVSVRYLNVWLKGKVGTVCSIRYKAEYTPAFVFKAPTENIMELNK